METESYNAPFVRQWDGQDHARFIQWAYDRFKGNTLYSSRYYFESSEAHQKRVAEARYAVLHKLYRVGKLHRVLDSDYATFDRKMGDNYSWGGYKNPYGYAYRYGYRRKKNYSDYYPKDGAHFRCRVPLRITEKKVVSEEVRQKREWKRMKKRFQDGYDNRNKVFAKRMSNRCFRRYEKNEMAHGRYDELYMGKRKDYFDPWDWD